MSRLLIVESPTKAQAITKYLGSGWIVKASVGHICDLPVHELGIEAQTFRLHYEVPDEKKKVVAALRAAAKTADDVYLATDPDREGEAIAWHLQRELGLRNPKRVKFEEITPAECRSAVQRPGAIDMDLVNAQEARRFVDRRVGYPVSGALQRKSGRKGLSAGRVQTPGLGIVVRREAEIRNFVSVDHFGVVLTFVEENSKTWTAEWLTKPFLADGAKVFVDRAFADRVANLRDVRSVKCDDKVSLKAPPAPFTTSTLQQAASQKLKMNPKKAMQLAQSLFEKGLITYHRTDSPNLKAETIAAVREYAEAQGLPLLADARTFKVKASAQGAHEAIRPTDFALADATRHPDPSRCASADEQRLYDLIRTRALGSQLADAEYDVRTVVLEAVERIDGKAIHFAARGRTLRRPGFLTLTGGEDDATQEAREDPDAKNPVPRLEPGTLRTAARAKRQDKRTEPPQRYTKASLIKALEEEGVGRPSTFAAIVDTIEERTYVLERPDRKLVPTELGEPVYYALEGTFGFADLEYTRKMEATLDAIAAGKIRYEEFARAVDAQVERELGKFQEIRMPAGLQRESAGPCPVCAKGQVVKHARATAPAAKGGRGRKATPKATAAPVMSVWWGCDTFPACKASFTDLGGRPDLANPRVSAASAPDPNDPDAIGCPTCAKGVLTRRQGQYGPFWSCSAWKSAGCKAIFKDRDRKPDLTPPAKIDGPPCPQCKDGVMVKREGARGPWWGCSRYPRCKTKREDSAGSPAVWSGVARGRSRAPGL